MTVNKSDTTLESLKDRVRSMRREQAEREIEHSAVWTHSARINHYAIHLSDEDLLNIKLHTDLISGESSISYHHQYPPIDPEKFANIMGYQFFTEDLPSAYWLSEPAVPTSPMPVGVNYRGRLINRSISRFQSCITNLYHMGVLDGLRSAGDRQLIMEIGAGYGGLAHGLMQVAPGHTYVIVDLPETLFFSGVYLTINNPDKRIYVYEPETFTEDFLRRGIYEFDFVLLPHFVTEQLFALARIYLFINMMSFQEMQPAHIEGYLKLARSKTSGYFYSDNLDRHPFNTDLGERTVTSILEEYMELFPSPQFYQQKVSSSNAPWFFKSYLGVPKGRELSFPKPGPFLFNGGESKIGGARFKVYWENGKIRHEVRHSLTGALIAMARAAFKRIYREDLRIYFETVK